MTIDTNAAEENANVRYIYNADNAKLEASPVSR